MDRLHRLINILKLTPHRQPELVKEATHRLLNRNIRYDPKVDYFLQHTIEILLTYCDNDDGVQRSLFNDHLNCVMLAFQDHCYKTILLVLVEAVTNNGSARTVTAALTRIPQLVNNVRPIDLGCDPLKLLKSLIEVSRRSDDESVQNALDSTLSKLMPYLDHPIRNNKEAHFLANILVEVLLRNLSTQTRRNAISCLKSICLYSPSQNLSIVTKLKEQFDSISKTEDVIHLDISKFLGLCLAIREIPDFTEKHSSDIINFLVKDILNQCDDSNVRVAAIEATKETFLKTNIDNELFNYDFINSLIDRFLLTLNDKQQLMIRSDTKVILQSNTLSLISAIIQRKPNVVQSNVIVEIAESDSTNKHQDLMKKLLTLKNHPDVAVRNQIYHIIGDYIDALWKFPHHLGNPMSCDTVRELWTEFRNALNEDSTHPNVLKSCITAMNSCMNTIMNSDHCLHIVTYADFDRLIQLYARSNFKPVKVEVLNLFSHIDYLTLNYLDTYHWFRLRNNIASSLNENLQDRILTEIVVPSLTDESQMIRVAASSTLLSLVPKLYIGSNNQRSCDPIVSLGNDLTNNHLNTFDRATSQINAGGDDISTTNLRPSDDMIIRCHYKILSSSILKEECSMDQSKKFDSNKQTTSTNLARIVNLLRTALESSLDRGKGAVLSIVKTLLKLCKVYPVHQYPSSWDCRPSEHCECYTLLNLLLTNLENLTDPDVITEDLDAYQTFLALSSELLYALCYESVFLEYENQRMMPYHKRLITAREIGWSELTIKHPPIAITLQVYFMHLVKLLWLVSYVVTEKANPFSMTSKAHHQQTLPGQTCENNHSTLISNRLLFGKIHKKLESSYKSSKKNLKKEDEKFQQIVETCLSSISSLLEFMSTNQSKLFVRDILNYLKVTSSINNVLSLKCARQLLKSLFGINVLALYQVDPLDWFEEENLTTLLENEVPDEVQDPSLQGVYHHLVSRPYKLFSNYLSNNCSQITHESDRTLAALDFEARRALKVRYRVEEIIKSLFEFHPHQLVSPRIREVSDFLKTAIAEFTPVVMECMKNFSYGGFCDYQAEVLHFMSYLILLRVNYQKLPLANDFIDGIHKLLDDCAERKFIALENKIETILRNSFTFLILLTYQRGPNQPMFHIAAVIQKLDDLRATLSLTSTDEDVSKYVAPLLRCLVEDLFIYRTEHFQNTFLPREENTSAKGELVVLDKPNQEFLDPLEAERETVAHKLLTIIEHPEAYDLISILLLESRLNPDGTNLEKLSQRLSIILPEMFARNKLELADDRRLELTKRIFENISTEVFKPLSFIIRTLLETTGPPRNAGAIYFQRWMSLVIVDLHILTTQVKEEKFLARICELMSVKSFIQYLFQIIQLCASEIFLTQNESSNPFLIRQLAHYIYYITYMFQSGLFFELTKIAPELINTKSQRDIRVSSNFVDLCLRAREPSQEFDISICETLFYYLRYCHPDLTVMWCNLMMLLNQVDCNNDFWCNLLIYDCFHCQSCTFVRTTIKEPNNTEIKLTTNQCVKRPSSLNLLLDSAVDSTTQKTPCARPEIVVEPTKSSFSRNSGRNVNRPSSLNLLDISFNDQLRRSFIKRIAVSEARPRTYDRNAPDTCLGTDTLSSDSTVDASLVGQCLAPNVELSRRGALCMVLDFVSISMDDVEHITWLVIHHINDIIRWSHEMPIAEFINAVHGNSASSGIFIQAIDTNINDLTSFSYVTRLLWSLEKVHYTQYGSLVVLLVEKLLSSPDLTAYRGLTKKVEDFACEAVHKLLNDTNKSLVTTNEETINQLTPDDLDKIISMLDGDLYPRLTELLYELRNS